MSLGAFMSEDLVISPSDLTLNTSDPAPYQLGARVTTGDGRYFRLIKAGAVNLAVGTLLQASAEVTADQNLAVAATSASSNTITTTSTVTVTANQFAEGYVHITTGPGAGYQYKIKSHPAATAAALTLTLYDTVQVALTTSSRIDLVANNYSGVVINPTTATSAPIGVAVYPVTAGNYGFAQVKGVANILNDGGSTVGTNVSASNGTAGAVEAAVTAQAAIGVAVTGVASTEYGAIKLNLE